MARTTLARAAGVAALALAGGGAAAQVPRAAATPIEHLIVVIGENRSFDQLFATYEAPRGQRVANLLSRGIVRADGSPGPDFALAAQYLARSEGAYSAVPPRLGRYERLPPPNTASMPGEGAPRVDARVGALPNGPFQLSPAIDAAAYSGDPVHRFFQMWQQVDGGRADLYVWAAHTAGTGPSNDPPGDDPRGVGSGALPMGFFNMQRGDAPYLRALAQRYALADNYHQEVMGGSTVNYFALVTGDQARYEVQGRPAVPPARRVENPDPRLGSDNRYREDGYDGGSYVACADAAAPGVAGVRAALARLPYALFRGGNCAPDTYYMVNNLEPPYTPDGRLQPEAGTTRMTPQTLPSIADALRRAGVSWKWYSGGRNDGRAVADGYCATCDPLSAIASVMQGPDRERLQDLGRLAQDLRDPARFPQVAFVVPPDERSGHPGSSTVAAFEGFVREVLEQLQAQEAVWGRSALLVTFDESGGYYDSGYIQFIDFFGDGPRVPLLAISPFARAGAVDHTYYDHASILKFIERNWRLAPLSARSRDALPDPRTDDADPYVPENRPALGDLMNLFDFPPPAVPGRDGS